MASDVSGVNLAEASKLAVASSGGVDLHDHPSTGIFFVSETVLRYEVKSPEELLQLVAKGIVYAIYPAGFNSYHCCKNSTTNDTKTSVYLYYCSTPSLW